MLFKKVPVEVVQVIQHHPDVVTFDFKYLGQPLGFKPGQFVHLSLDDFDPAQHWPESRPFSIASAPSSFGKLQLTVSRQGTFTSRILNELKLGMKVWMKGPYGEFVVQPREVKDALVFIAGGTGVTPFCSFFNEIILKKQIISHSIVLYYGAKTKELLIYRDQIEKLYRYVPNLQCFYYVEQLNNTEGFYSGRLDIEFIYRNLPSSHSYTYYLSGPMQMIQSFQNYLIHDVALPRDKVIVDQWI